MNIPSQRAGSHPPPPSAVADAALATRGAERIQQAQAQMPVIARILLRGDAGPLHGQRIACCAHVTKETGAFVRALLAAGAEVAFTGGNSLTTQDDVAAALAAEGARVFAWRGMSAAELKWGMAQVIDCFVDGPTLVVDDGADLICLLHEEYPDHLHSIVGAVEKTSSGVARLRAMAQAGKLRIPVLAVNDVITKWECDNVWGTAQSTMAAVLRACNVLLAGKTVVVVGFGHVGRGVAIRAKGMGARVIVTCVRATTALRALYSGFQVLPMAEAAAVGDLFCTTTGVRDVISGRHLDAMKHGAILCNVGHSACEINLTDLAARTTVTRECGPWMNEHQLRSGRSVFVLGGGGLINLIAAEGCPSEVMDLSFSNVLLSLVDLRQRAGSLTIDLHDVPAAQDEEVAGMKLASCGIVIDRWTSDQSAYAADFLRT